MLTRRVTRRSHATLNHAGSLYVSCMKKLIIIIILLAVVALQCILAGVHGDGMTIIRSTVSVVDAKDRPINNVVLNRIFAGNIQQQMGVSNQNGVVEVSFPAGWSSFSTLIYS